MKRVFLTSSDREFNFDPENTSAAEWPVYATEAAAKRAACHPAYNPTIWAWRGGFITAPAGHPVPQSATFVASSVCGRWRPASWVQA